VSACLDLRKDAARFAPELGDYDARLRPAAIATWRARMVNEHSSSRVFDALAQQLAATGFASEYAEACRGFADEERRHGILCGAVVTALGGTARAELGAPEPYPEHRDAPPRAATLRNLIHVCCLSETVAVSLIGDERLRMPQGPLRELLTKIYADEIGHARFGWRLLEQVAPTLSAEEREAVERYLPVAFAHLEQHELSLLPERQAPDGGEVLGLCGGHDARALFYETLAAIIRPGLGRWFARAETRAGLPLAQTPAAP
jgi:hypothetical protein